MILVFQAFFHACQMNQVQHLAPVDGVVRLNGPGRIPDGFFDELQVLKGYLEQTFRRLYEEGKVVETEAYAYF